MGISIPSARSASRALRIAVTGSALVALLALSGCAASESAKGVWGYVADARDAQIEIAAEQPGVNTLAVARVQAPQEAWIVVHADDNGKPGKRVGLLHVEKGESTSVEVPLEGVTTNKVIVALHADRGTPGKFDFDMMNKKMSADRPFFVNRKELATVVTVR